MEKSQEEEKKADYSQMTNEEFYDILADIVHKEGASILSIGDVYSILAEHFNNDVLDEWAAKNPDKAYPDRVELMVFKRPTMSEYRKCFVHKCEKRTNVEYTVTAQFEPDRFSIWRPCCDSHKPTKNMLNGSLVYWKRSR